MLLKFLIVLLMFLIVGIIVGTILFLASVLGPKKMNPAKAKPFECGHLSIIRPEGRIAVRFFVVALLFVIFDIEIFYLYPWAVVFKELGFLGFIEMLIFLLILVAGFIYLWKRGALEWE
jgi:NADH-quinone oxidoreductase subunit A